MKCRPAKFVVGSVVQWSLGVALLFLWVTRSEGETFVWKDPVDGDYGDVSKWIMNQNGVAVPATRIPGAQDEVMTRDGSFKITLSGQSADSFSASSDNLLFIGGSFQVGRLEGSPTILGSGVLTASVWNFSPSDAGFPNGVIDGAKAMVGEFSLVGNGFGVSIRNGGTLESTKYFQTSAPGRRPIIVTGGVSRWVHHSDISLAPQLELTVSDGGVASLQNVAGGPELYVDGTGSLISTHTLEVSKFKVSNGGLLSSGPTVASGFNNLVTSKGLWQVNGELKLNGNFGPVVSILDDGLLKADSMLLDNHAELVVGGDLEGGYGGLAISGKLVKKVATIRGSVGKITCASAEFGPGEASLGQIGVDLEAILVLIQGDLVINGSVRCLTGDLVANRCVLGKDPGTHGQLDLDILSDAHFAGSLIVGEQGAGVVILKETKEFICPKIILGEEAGSSGVLALQEKTQVSFVGNLTVGQSGAATLNIGSSANLDLEGVQPVLVGVEKGAYGKIIVSGTDAQLSQFPLFSIGSPVMFVGMQGRGELDVSSGGSVEVYELRLGQSMSDNLISVNNSSSQALQPTFRVFGQAVVGDGGRGVVEVNAGSVASAREWIIGNESTATNWIRVDPSSRLVGKQHFVLGQGNGTHAVLESRGKTVSEHRLTIGGTDGANGRCDLIGNAADLEVYDSGQILMSPENSAQSLFVMTGGAQARTPTLDMIPRPGGSASLSLDGQGTSLLVIERFEIGLLHRSAGLAKCAITGGAHVDVVRELRVGRTGILDVSGGSMSVGSSLPPPLGVLRVGVGGFAGIAGGFIGREEVLSGAHFAPGASPGIAEIQGSLLMEAGSALDLEVGGISPGTTYDSVHTSEDLTVLGQVNLQFINGFAPKAGQSFALVKCDKILKFQPSAVIVSGLAEGFQFTLLPDGKGSVVLKALKDGTALSQPELSILPVDGGIELLWPADPAWTLEARSIMGGQIPWFTPTNRPSIEVGYQRLLWTPKPSPELDAFFFRLRKP